MNGRDMKSVVANISAPENTVSFTFMRAPSARVTVAVTVSERLKT